MTYWKLRDRRTGLFSTEGIDAEFDSQGRAFKNKIGVKGSMFHYVYGFQIDDDGVRRFHQRREHDSIDDFEAVRFEGNRGAGHNEAEVIAGRQMFTHNQLLNKEDRDLDGLSSSELAAERRKQF